MHTGHIDLSSLIISGARTAYYLDNPPGFGRSFEEWLSAAGAVTAATGTSHIVVHLQELCRRAIKRESRCSIDELSFADRVAVSAAHAAFNGISELERLGGVAAEQGAPDA